MSTPPSIGAKKDASSTIERISSGKGKRGEADERHDEGGKEKGKQPIVSRSISCQGEKKGMVSETPCRL